MSILFRTIQKAHRLKHSLASPRLSNVLSQTLGFSYRTYSEKSVTKSPFDSNILRILRNEIEYLAPYVHQVLSKFKILSILLLGFSIHFNSILLIHHCYEN
jgi:complement component 1 Q subcomponent-binding protein